MSTKRKKWASVLRQEMTLAEEILVKENGLSGTILLFNDDVKIYVPRPDGNDPSGDPHVLPAPMAALAHDGVACCVLGEAWVRKLAKRIGESEREFYRRSQAVRPRDAEDRI